MEIWFIIIVTACIITLLNALISLTSWKQNHKLPPGPRGIPIITTLSWLGKSSTDMEEYLRKLRTKFGPIITMPIGSRPLVFISSHSLAHQALVHHGGIFGDRPKPPPTAKFSNMINISSSAYGPTWRTLRRNLTSQILHPSKAKEFSHARKWALDILVNSLGKESEISSDKGGGVKVIDHFRFSMFCLLVFMCVGDKLDESQVKDIETVLHSSLLLFTRVQVLNFWPWLTKIVLKNRWNELLESRRKQKEILIPYIRTRKQLMQGGNLVDRDENYRLVNSYVDSLLKLEISEGDDEKRKLNEEEIVFSSTEFLNAGTDTTSTALQWILANIVKNPDIQANILKEIKGVIGSEAKDVSEDELSKMTYLKAVVLEGLRRHPPGHFVLPHSVTQEVELGGYKLPKNAIINFTVAELGWDPEVWEDPMQFKPERFLQKDGQEEFDITGSREIKMMPFGAGRRICPGLGLALLHLEYFVANLVWKFEWSACDGHEVDLSEKQEFTIVMKNPLHACISPRKVE